MILLIPAGWSLWLTPNAPPSLVLVIAILLGGLFISGAGCIANDIWDRKIDQKISRTQNRPLAEGSIDIATALLLMILMLALSFLVVITLPIPFENKITCLYLALLALPPILIYPSSKRWFKYPQAILSICWGFSVLIPWAASQAPLSGQIPLIACWGATVIWTFGFDTIYALSDAKDDARLGIQSSALNLGDNVITTVSICYFLTAVLLAIGAFYAGCSFIFWPFWLLSGYGMQQETALLKRSTQSNIQSTPGRHFKNQVLLGALILLGLILS